MAHVGHVGGWVATERRPPSLRSAWVGLGLAVACAATYVVSLVLPYYANGLQGSSQEELWAHELTQTWPYGTALDVPLGLAGTFAITVGPFLAAGTLWWSARTLWVHHGRLTAPVLRLVVATLLASVIVMAWLPTPLAGQLVSWFVD
jgi:hypothetical protein